MAYDTNLTFTLGKNNKGDNPKRPDYRGEVFIDGKVYKLSGWIRDNKAKGTKFISGNLQLDEPKPVDNTPPEAPAGGLVEDVPL